METTNTSSPYTALSGQVNTALEELNADPAFYVPDQQATELFRLEEKVQIFFVTSDGHVSTFSAPETLRIFKFNQADEGSTNVFLQVGGWTHPLIAEASPCLQAQNGALMFPDIYSDTPNNAVGLVLLDDVSPETRGELLNHLRTYTAFKAEAQEEDHQLGALGSAILKGAELVTKGLEYGTDKAGKLIEYASEKSQEQLAKGNEDAKVGSVTKHTVNAAKHTTNATVKVSGYVANRVGKLTKSLADYLASKGPSRTKSGKGDGSDGLVGSIVDAARGGLIAYGTVYSNLETNAKVLGKQLKDNSVKVVQHKYGTEAAGVASEAMTAAGNGAMTYMNIQSLGVKGLVKDTAKQTGKNVLKNVVVGKPKEVK